MITPQRGTDRLVKLRQLGLGCAAELRELVRVTPTADDLGSYSEKASRSEAGS